MRGRAPVWLPGLFSFPAAGTAGGTDYTDDCTDLHGSVLVWRRGGGSADRIPACLGNCVPVKVPLATPAAVAVAVPKENRTLAPLGSVQAGPTYPCRSVLSSV